MQYTRLSLKPIRLLGWFPIHKPSAWLSIGSSSVQFYRKVAVNSSSWPKLMICAVISFDGSLRSTGPRLHPTSSLLPPSLWSHFPLVMEIYCNPRIFMCMCPWRPEGFLGFLPLRLFTLVFATGSVTKPGGHGFSQIGWLVSSGNLPSSALPVLRTQVLQRHTAPFSVGPRDPNLTNSSLMEPFLQELAKSFAKRGGIRTFKSPLLCAGQRVADGGKLRSRWSGLLKTSPLNYRGQTSGSLSISKTFLYYLFSGCVFVLRCMVLTVKRKA